VIINDKMKNGTAKYKQEYSTQMTILWNNGKTKKEINTSNPYRLPGIDTLCK